MWTYPHRGDAIIELFIVLLHFSSVNRILVTLAVDSFDSADAICTVYAKGLLGLIEHGWDSAF